MPPYVPPPVPTILSYAEWIKGTTLQFKPRSADLRRLDDAMMMFERTPTSRMLDGVRQAFLEWKMSKGKAWTTSERNGKGTIALLDAQLGGADDDAVFGVSDFMAPALINARLGVLYLFAHTRIDESMFRIVLDGAVDVTTAALTYGSERIKETDEESAVASRMEKWAGRLEKHKDTLVDAAVGARNVVRDAIKEDGGAGRVVSGATILQSRPNPPKDPALLRALAWIRDKLADIANRVVDYIKEKLAEAKDMVQNALTLENLPGHLRTLCNYLAERFLAKAAPFIGAGLDIAKGVGNSLDAGLAKFREWMAGKDVKVLSGHPGAIVEAIRHAMWLSVGSGLYDLVKGGISLGSQFMTAGAASLVALLASVFEALVKMVWRLIEVARMRRCFEQAKVHWQARNERNALQAHPIAFNGWFKGFTVTCPALAVLALNSGICGDKMHFLQMYKGDNAVISTSQFKAGVAYVDSLKQWGAKYLSDTGYAFSSDDELVAGLLSRASEVRGPSGTAAKAWQATLGFLNA